MNARSIHAQLISFAASAMFSSAVLMAAPHGTIDAAAGPQPQAVVNALNALRSGGFAGLKDVSVPDAVSAPMSAPAAAQAPAEAPAPLSPAQIAKLHALTASYGHDSPIDKSVTDALDLTTGADILTLRELTTPHPDKSVNVISFLPNSENILVAFQDNIAIYIYKVTPDFKLIAAIRKVYDGLPVVIPFAEAQADARTQLEYWAQVADLH